MTKVLQFISGVTTLLLLSGCLRAGPDYVPPEVEMPSAWRESGGPSYQPAGADYHEWWSVFNDPLLNRLVEKAFTDNFDLRITMERIVQAQANLTFAGASYFPQADTKGQIQWTRSSEQSGGRQGSPIYSHISAELVSSWELDLFGRIERSVEAASADLETTREDMFSARVSLAAQVGRTYMIIRNVQSDLQVAEKNIEAQKAILKLTRTREESGLASALDVAQAERVLASSEAEVPPLRAELTAGLNTLALLLGERPGFMAEELVLPQPMPAVPDKILVGVPADLLRQRPDIRAAERTLAAETARIGVAAADLYPTLSLSGFFGFDALRFDNLFRHGSYTWGAGPSLLWNVFDAGKIRSRITAQSSRANQALLSYEQQVLNALSEVENSLRGYLEQRERVAALERTVDASRRTLDLATNLYKDGLAEFQNVLDAETALFTYERQLEDAKGTALTNLIDLYSAFGGGWNPDESIPELQQNNQQPEVKQ